MAPSNDNPLDADKMFRVYLYDYMIKRGLHTTAEVFKNEANVATDPPIAMSILDLDSVRNSPDGFLHEWWSVFYEVFTSRQARHRETGPESSNQVAIMADNPGNGVPFRTPQIPMNEQIPQQFQATSSCFNNMMPPHQAAACLIPQALYNKENLGYLPNNVEPSFLSKTTGPKFLPGMTSLNHPLRDGGKPQVFKDNGIIRVGRSGPTDPHQTIRDEAPKLVPPNGLPSNVAENQAFASLFQTQNYLQQCQVLKTPNQDAVLTQELACTSRSQTFKYSNQNPNISQTESSNKDRETMDRAINTEEPQGNQDQQIQVQSQNVEDCVDAGKPVDENVESFLSTENEHADHRTLPFSNLKRISTTKSRKNKGFSFEEVGCLHSCKNKVLSSHFSSDGKVLASAGHEKKVFIWNTETFEFVSTGETHSHIITDVRFKSGSTIFATSSFDRSVRLWDATRPAKSFFKLNGHAEQVMSLDFHPRKVDLLCSCDSNDVIRLWNVNQGVCMHITKGGSKQVRFQPYNGRFLATATGNNAKIIDIESDTILCHLKGHVKDVLSICWDRSGKYIASVSEDSARVWSDGKCISELHSDGNKFQSCIFHPAYVNLLIIGGYQSLELWSPTESSKTLAIHAHNGLIAGLADSPGDELIASASHDNCVKLWK